MLLGIEIRGFSALTAIQMGLTRQDLSMSTDRSKTALDLSATDFSDASKPKPDVRPILPLTAIIGRNATGKTSVFEAIDFLSDCVRYSVREAATLKNRGSFAALKTHGYAKPMFFCAHVLNPDFAEILSWTLEIATDQYGRPYVVQETVEGRSCTRQWIKSLGLDYVRTQFPKGCPRYEGVRPYLRFANQTAELWSPDQINQVPLSRVDRSCLSLIGAFKHYEQLSALCQMVRGWYYCRLHEMQSGQASWAVKDDSDRPEDAEVHHHLDSYAANLTAVLRWLKREDYAAYQRMLDQIATYLPKIKAMSEHQISRGLSQRERQLFVLLLLLNDPKPRSLILFEDPDIGLFHEMVDALGLAMRQYSLQHAERAQLCFSTHNTNLIDPLCPQEVWQFVRSDAAKKIQPPIQCHNCADLPDVQTLYDEGVGMGSLWYSGHLDVD